jgi:hypothetical protein
MFSTLLLAGSLMLAQSPQAPPEDLARQVRQLVRDLAAPELAKRDAAQKALIDLGPAVLDLLPAPTDRTSAEEKQRLSQIRDRLQRAQAENSLKATTVTLQGEMRLSEAFKAIEKQTGNVMIDYREQFGGEGGDPKLKLSLTNVPFWKGVDEVLDQAGLTVYAYPERDGVAAISLPEGELPRGKRQASYAGAFRLEALEMMSRRSLRTPTDQQLQLSLEISWEPRLEPIAIQHQLADMHAVDEEGNTLELDGDDETREAPVNPGEATAELMLPFKLPDRKVKRIASLKGKLLVMVPGRIETFRFDDLTQKNVEQRKAGVVVVLDQVRKNADVWEARVLVRFDKADGALESHRQWIFANECYLETPGKERIENDGYETTRQTAEEVGMAYLFDLPNGPKGLKMVYKTPSVVSLVPIEFEIKNLELP